MRCRRLFLSVIPLVLLLPPVAYSTTIVPAEFAEMVAGSRLIVHGTITDVRSQAIAGRGSIESIVTVAVVTPIKGTAATRIAFRVPNGQIGRYRRVTVGAPEFTAGDEVVLFLSGQPPVVPMPFGLNQGVYRVARSGAQTSVTPVVPTGAGRIVRGDPARRPLTLDAFAQQVRAILEERRQGVPGDREERRQGVPGDREERRQGVPGDREERRQVGPPKRADEPALARRVAQRRDVPVDRERR